jgi:carbonic anhydrase
MWKVMKGIVSFRERTLPKYARRFRKLASSQAPDTLFIGCSDSRVVPDLVTSTHPGDLFVMRNVGNLIPLATTDGISTGDLSEASAIEYAVLVLKVAEIIVCGHSECGAMKAATSHSERADAPNLNKWLQQAQVAKRRLDQKGAYDASLKPHDQLSQLNVLVQLEHLASYPVVRERVTAGTLRLHGWWFDVAAGSMYAHDAVTDRFELIDRRMAKQMAKQRMATVRQAAQPA